MLKIIIIFWPRGKMKRIVLCADDYGQAPAISEGILELVKRKRLSAVSCMVNTLTWPAAAKDLLPYRDDVDVGLHFNLTHGHALSADYQSAYGESFPTLTTIMQKALLLSLNQQVIAAECLAQIDAFVAAMGCLPAFIDGHQHVHHLPVIRQALVDVYNQRLKDARSYVRLVNMRFSLADIPSKKLVIYLTGGCAFKKLLDKHGIPHNNSFSGVYSFAQAASFPAIFPTFLSDIQDNGLIMCHPGLASSDATDEIAKSRVLEYQYLCSPEFEQACVANGIILKRLLA
jgi:predicted glycoside hydrolase/deacetylase ChbG (UPF0249 family)